LVGDGLALVAPTLQACVSFRIWNNSKKWLVFQRFKRDKDKCRERVPHPTKGRQRKLLARGTDKQHKQHSEEKQ
jgi:hypothetical protein